jgi:hypothetical protein
MSAVPAVETYLQNLTGTIQAQVIEAEQRFKAASGAN